MRKAASKNGIAVCAVLLVSCSSAVHERASTPEPARVAPVPPAVEAAPPAAAPELVRAPVAPPPEAPPKVAPEPQPPVGPPQPVFPVRAPPYRVLILGDSMAATDFGRALEKKLDVRTDVEVARRGKSATGLARPDYFDWMAEAEARVKRHDPDLVVVIIGGNDGQDLQPKSKKSKVRRVFWKSDAWDDAYAERLVAFCLTLLEDHRRIVWLELPVMDHRSLEKKLTRIRQVQRDALGSLIPRVAYVETRPHFLDAKGRILRKVSVDGYRSAQVLRQDDGIHFTVPGSRYFADKVAPDVLAALGLEDGGAL